MKTQSFFFVLLTMILILSACSPEAPIQPQPIPFESFTLISRGASTGVEQAFPLPGLEQTIQGLVYNIDLFDQNDNLVGSVAEIDVAYDMEPDGTLRRETYSVFRLNDDKDQIVLHSHILAIPADELNLVPSIDGGFTQQNVIAGTGKYADVQGVASLSGLIDASAFDKKRLDFNCRYEFDLQK